MAASSLKLKIMNIFSLFFLIWAHHFHIKWLIVINLDDKLARSLSFFFWLTQVTNILKSVHFWIFFSCCGRKKCPSTYSERKTKRHFTINNYYYSKNNQISPLKKNTSKMSTSKRTKKVKLIKINDNLMFWKDIHIW